ncbi:DUF1906 domain-containing protein [Nocardia sp. XZ_19_385]|uniref:DUF1906 domain-containing protein n=1 Tax=Nocardia sp. XZ_19_385 TaxID=2769488 RepID=UPI00188E5F87|nr:DUF1906 domain-containing protein [Nocardia sp. XZ_19_385]
MDLSRRSLFTCAAAVAAVGLTAPRVSAEPLGTLLDYAGGVPSVDAIMQAGHLGAIRYVSDRRPGAEWMLGKPLLAGEAEALRAAGLQVVSCYQFGKGPTADWRGGFEAGQRHAERGLQLHLEAGGPADRPIYTSIDDNPSIEDFDAMVRPYLEGWESVAGHQNTGVYANAPTIDWAIAAGLGSYFWQHNWGTPQGYVHPAAQLHQFEIDKRVVDGIGVDLNHILAESYGQW